MNIRFVARRKVFAVMSKRLSKLQMIFRKQYMLILIVLMYLCIFQNALEKIFSGFRYIDECIALMGVGLVIENFLSQGMIRIKREYLPECIALVIFLCVGLLGNVVYRYQPVKTVLVDLFTHVKFFFALVVGYMVLPPAMSGKDGETVAKHMRVITVFMFVLFIAERIYPIFGSTQIRYGIRSARIIYSHPTYLASAMIFMALCMTMFYKKKNIYFIACCLVMMVFTVRSKAMASATLFATLFFYIVILGKRLKRWHMIAGVVLATAIGWNMISYYFFELSSTESARSAMLVNSFRILWDYFPIGTGFGTYGSNAAATNYSPVYYLYGMNKVFGLQEGGDFLNDQFWPIIVGQTGLIGTVSYLFVQYRVFRRIIPLKTINYRWFMIALYILIYLLISSTAEVAFNNPVAMPLAILLGGLFYHVDMNKCEKVVEGV